MKHSRKHNDFKWAISLDRFMLRVVGLWPPDNYDTREAVKSKIRLLYNIITMLFVLIIPTLISLIRVWGDMILMIENMQYSLPFMSTIFKISIIWYKQADLLPLINMMERDWMKPKTKEERDVMLNRARIIRVIAICGISWALCGITITFSFPYFGLRLRQVTNLTDFGKPLPIPSYYLHNVSKSPQYELTLLMQSITATACGCSYTTIDHFLGLLVLHICGQLENLHLRLSRMEKYSNFNAALEYNVQDHIRIIRSVDIIDHTFNSMLLVLVLYFGVLFCFQAFLIVEVVNRKGQLSLTQMIWFVAAIIYILMHMCLYCIVGEILVMQSEKIHQATYKYPWYNKDPKVAKSLMLIMLRASKPLYITAGKTFPMTMATFCNLLKTSAGYVSVLLANHS
ncbi:odorant receptor 43a-like isoform X2 [Harpegnathos saltator]|uniref:odorant receptor 43a-like isoform X2 n=1 Tax=Harpegnathos saltator TaxID=610380 RepID=UPI000948C37C|nr:odorant receptor 43a-like isoform X2 [Harpegnathos saltator]